MFSSEPQESNKQEQQSDTVTAKPYSKTKIHRIMIADKLRTNTYRKAIFKHITKDDTVFDLGCGSGILSFFAAQKGCKKIYAIDSSDMIRLAEKTAHINNLDKNIQFIHSDLYDCKIPEKVDILLHEQIGVYIWDEDLFSKIRYAKEKILKPEGKILPALIEFFIVPSCYKSEHEKSVEFWNTKIYGLDFSPFRKQALKENIAVLAKPIKVDIHDTASFISVPKIIHTINLQLSDELPNKIEKVFISKKNEVIRGLVGYFKVKFDNTLSFSTSPKKNNTHWGQMFLPLFEPKRVKKGEKIHFSFEPKEKTVDWKYSVQIHP